MTSPVPRWLAPLILPSRLLSVALVRPHSLLKAGCLRRWDPARGEMVLLGRRSHRSHRSHEEEVESLDEHEPGSTLVSQGTRRRRVDPVEGREPPMMSELEREEAADPVETADDPATTSRGRGAHARRTGHAAPTEPPRVRPPRLGAAADARPRGAWPAAPERSGRTAPSGDGTEARETPWAATRSGPDARTPHPPEHRGEEETETVAGPPQGADAARTWLPASAPQTEAQTLVSVPPSPEWSASSPPRAAEEARAPEHVPASPESPPIPRRHGEPARPATPTHRPASAAPPEPAKRQLSQRQDAPWLVRRGHVRRDLRDAPRARITSPPREDPSAAPPPDPLRGAEEPGALQTDTPSGDPTAPTLPGGYTAPAEEASSWFVSIPEEAAPWSATSPDEPTSRRALFSDEPATPRRRPPLRQSPPGPSAELPQQPGAAPPRPRRWSTSKPTSPPARGPAPAPPAAPPTVTWAAPGHVTRPERAGGVDEPPAGAQVTPPWAATAPPAPVAPTWAREPSADPSRTWADPVSPEPQPRWRKHPVPSTSAGTFQPVRPEGDEAPAHLARPQHRSSARRRPGPTAQPEDGPLWTVTRPPPESASEPASAGAVPSQRPQEGSQLRIEAPQVRPSLTRAVQGLDPERRAWVGSVDEALGEAAARALVEAITVHPPDALAMAALDEPSDALGHDGEPPPPAGTLIQEALALMTRQTPEGRALLKDVHRELERLAALDRTRAIA